MEMPLNIFIRSLAFIIAVTTVVPKSYAEMKKSDNKLGRVPFLLFCFWSLGSTFILSSIFFIYLGFDFLGTLDSFLLLTLSIIASMLYSGNNISNALKELFEEK